MFGFKTHHIPTQLEIRNVPGWAIGTNASGRKWIWRTIWWAWLGMAGVESQEQQWHFTGLVLHDFEWTWSSAICLEAICWILVGLFFSMIFRGGNDDKWLNDEEWYLRNPWYFGVNYFRTFRPSQDRHNVGLRWGNPVELQINIDSQSNIRDAGSTEVCDSNGV